MDYDALRVRRIVDEREHEAIEQPGFRSHNCHRVRGATLTVHLCSRFIRDSLSSLSRQRDRSDGLAHPLAAGIYEAAIGG